MSKLDGQAYQISAVLCVLAPIGCCESKSWTWEDFSGDERDAERWMILYLIYLK